jgi:hypothetical protein
MDIESQAEKAIKAARERAAVSFKEGVQYTFENLLSKMYDSFIPLD